MESKSVDKLIVDLKERLMLVFLTQMVVPSPG